MLKIVNNTLFVLFIVGLLAIICANNVQSTSSRLTLESRHAQRVESKFRTFSNKGSEFNVHHENDDRDSKDQHEAKNHEKNCHSCECDFRITQQDLNPATGYIAVEHGVYCVCEDLTFGNPTHPAITIQSSSVTLRFNFHTLDLLGTGFAGVVVDKNVTDVRILEGTIKNSVKPPLMVNAQGQLSSSLFNFQLFDVTSLIGFCIGLNNNVSNVLIEDVVTDRCFVGIGNNGTVKQIDIQECAMYNFGFDYFNGSAPELLAQGGPGNFRGIGFLFVAPFPLNNPNRTESISIRNSVSESVTGQFGMLFREVENIFVDNCVMRLGINNPPTLLNEGSVVLRLQSCFGATVRNTRAHGGRTGFVSANVAGAKFFNCEATQWTRTGFELAAVGGGFPVPSGNVIDGCLATQNILLPFMATGATIPERGVGFLFNGVSDSSLINSVGSGIRQNFFQACIAFIQSAGGVPMRNVVYNNHCFNNTYGIGFFAGTNANANGGNMNNNTFRTNTIVSNRVGIQVNFAAIAPFNTRNQFLNNQVSVNTQFGIVDNAITYTNRYWKNWAADNGNQLVGSDYSVPIQAQVRDQQTLTPTDGTAPPGLVAQPWANIRSSLP
jgi:hypothetical protein